MTGGRHPLGFKPQYKSFEFLIVFIDIQFKTNTFHCSLNLN